MGSIAAVLSIPEMGYHLADENTRLVQSAPNTEGKWALVFEFVNRKNKQEEALYLFITLELAYQLRESLPERPAAKAKPDNVAANEAPNGGE